MAFDLSKPYQTRDGREAQAIAGPDGCLYGWIHIKHIDVYCVFWWNPDGSSASGGDGESDLVNIAEKRTVKVWINCYDQESVSWQVLYVRRSDADACASPERIACIAREITFEVGEGLEER